MALRSFFRSEALEHMSQREPIDGLAKVTVPFDWLVLAVLAFLCGAIVLWSVLGSVERTLRADALVVMPDDRRAVVAPVGGRVRETMIDTGDHIDEGWPVARISVPDLANRLVAARERERVILEELSQAAPEAGLSQMLVGARAEAVALAAMIERVSVIASPVAGEVIEHRLAPGAVVAAGEEVARVRVGPPAALIAVVPLPGGAADVQLGAAARLRCNGDGREYLETRVAEVSSPSMAWSRRLSEAGLDPEAPQLRLTLPDGATVQEGDRCELRVVVDARAPLRLLLGAARES